MHWKDKSDTELREKLKAVSNADERISIAKEAGFMVSAEGLKILQLKEISDDDPERGYGPTTLACSVCEQPVRQGCAWS